MPSPISPPAVTNAGIHDLPAYVSNGLVGMRVLDIPLLSSAVLLNGYAGSHPRLQIDAAAEVPDPLSGDIAINDLWLRTAPQQAEFVEQSYDFSAGELHTRFRYVAEGTIATVDVLTLCSRVEPTIALQEISVTVSAICTLALRSIVDVAGIYGSMYRRNVGLPGGMEGGPDGSLAWHSLGQRAICGIAYSTHLTGDTGAQRSVLDWGVESSLCTEYRMEARPGTTYRLRQIASLVPDVLHQEPDQQAARLVSKAARDGFDKLRAENRSEWDELWRGRVVIDSDDDRWQALADAAFYYLNSSVHLAAPSSTSMYGLATWHNYHYYYGHVMWDIDLFAVSPLAVTQPAAARALVDFRKRTIGAAMSNAKLYGRQGVQFPWESGPLNGEEVAPGPGTAAWYEDHVSVDVAWSFWRFANLTGDERFLRESAAPILFGVSDWIASRVTPTRDGYTWQQTMGIAEREEPSDNVAYTIMAAHLVLDAALATAARLGINPPDTWQKVRNGLCLPRLSRTGAVASHDDYRSNETKGGTPGPLTGIFPLGYKLEPATQSATLDYYLALADKYIGSPMLSPLYGVWAARTGDRALALRLLDEGYAQMVGGRFSQPLEMSPAKFPDQPKSGPFFANMGGFLASLIYGFTRIEPSPGPVETWATEKVILPKGWRSIRIERAWIRQAPAAIEANQGDKHATIRLQS